MTTTTAPSPGQRLDDRYGRNTVHRKRNRLWLILTLVVLIGATAAWGAWSGLGGTSTDTLDLQTNSFALHGDRAVTVGWTVGGDTGEALICTIAAEASDHSVVGVVTTRLAPSTTGSTTRSGTTTVRVMRAAVTGLISSCARA